MEYRRIISTILFFLFLISSARLAFADNKPSTAPSTNADGGLKPFDEATKDAVASQGLFTLYRTKEGKLYLEIKPDQLDAPFLFTSYLTRGIGLGEVISGMPLDNFIFEFHRADGNVEFVEKNPYFRANPDSTDQKAVQQDFADSVLHDMPIVSIQDGTNDLLVDASPLFLSDLANLSDTLNDTMGGDYSLDDSTSYFEGDQSFPLNVEIQTSQNFQTHSQPHNVSSLQAVTDWRDISVGIHYSLAAIPQDHYLPRLSDTRIGYFETSLEDFSSRNPDTPIVRYINRWNMANKPIVFWIENTTPPEYRDAIASGVLEWNKAFARIGIPDALQVKVQPDDADWKPGDVRYNLIYWTDASNSDFAAVGPAQVNPTTGEIYNAAVVIDGESVRRAQYIFRYEKELQENGPSSSAKALRVCNLESLESREAQTGALSLALQSPSPGNFEVPKSYVDAYLKDLVMHEIGHCLGLRHNFHAGSMLPLNEINDKKITEKTGLAASVMDYLPVNIAPKGEKQGDYFDPTIGPYDYWAIRYGYLPVKAETPDQEKPVLSQIASQSAQPGHLYETDEDAYSPYSADPLAMIFNLSKDPLDFAAQRFKMYQALLGEINKKLPVKGTGYFQARDALDLVMAGYQLFLDTPLRYVGGEYFSRSHAGDPGAGLPVVPVNRKAQLKALQVLNQYLFRPDAFSLSPAFLDKLAPERYSDHFFPISAYITPFDYPIREKITGMQQYALDQLFRPVLLSRLLDERHQALSGGDAFTLQDLFSWMTRSFFSEVAAGKDISDMRRSLQQAYLEHLIGLVLHPSPQVFTSPDADADIPATQLATVPQDARDLALHYLGAIRDEMQKDLNRNGKKLDLMTVAHLQASVREIDQALQARPSEAL